MSSFLFLTFCVYVFCCLGLHFSAVPLSNPFFRWLLPVPHKPPQEPYTPPTGPVLCSASVVSLPVPNRTQAAQAKFGFLLQNELTPPLKGEGRDFAHLWDFGFSLAVACGNCCSQTAHTLQQGRSGALLVSLPTWLSKSNTGPHRAEFGFRLLTGASQEDFPLFRQSRIRTQAEEKNTSAPLF